MSWGEDSLFRNFQGFVAWFAGSGGGVSNYGTYGRDSGRAEFAINYRRATCRAGYGYQSIASYRYGGSNGSQGRGSRYYAASTFGRDHCQDGNARIYSLVYQGHAWVCAWSVSRRHGNSRSAATCGRQGRVECTVRRLRVSLVSCATTKFIANEEYLKANYYIMSQYVPVSYSIGRLVYFASSIKCLAFSRFFAVRAFRKGFNVYYSGGAIYVDGLLVYRRVLYATKSTNFSLCGAILYFYDFFGSFYYRMHVYSANEAEDGDGSLDLYSFY